MPRKTTSQADNDNTANAVNAAASSPASSSTSGNAANGGSVADTAPNAISNSRADTTKATDELIRPEDLDLASAEPLYKQVAEAIRSKIGSQQLSPGDRLPTEQHLSRTLGMGVSTVRNAYALLVDEGLVTRRAGRGSFVTKPQLSRQLKSLYTFTEDVRGLGMTPSSKVLRFCVERPSAQAAKELGVAPSANVYLVQRLRCANGNPIMLETSSVPVSLCPGLTQQEVEGSLYESMARHMGSAPVNATELHEASTLTAEEARLLGRETGAGTFRITRVTTNGRGEVCEYCLVVAPGDQTRYTIELGPNGSTATKNLSL